MKIVKTATSVIRSAGHKRFTATISTRTVDRQGDIIEPKGVDYSDYRAAGGFLLWGHDYRGMPVATAQRLWADDRGLYGEYLCADHPEARKVWEAVTDLGQMGVSIGFMPGRTEAITTGTRYLTCSMLEASLTPVPANPECLAVLRSKGLLPSGGGDLVFELADDDAVLEVGFDPAAFLRQRAAERRDELIDVDPGVLAEVVREAFEHAVTEKMAYLTGRLD